jgi:hypothetical protein
MTICRQPEPGLAGWLLGWIYGANYGVHRIRLRRGAPPAGRRDDETLQMVIEKMLAFDVMTVPFSYLCSITILLSS